MPAARFVVPGPCKLSWGGVDLGYTKSGISIAIETSMLPITDDEHGTEPADYILAGKSATVSGIFVDMVKVLAVKPYIGNLLSILDGSGNTQLGILCNNGDGGAQLGKPLIITERDNANTWTATFTLPTDPQQLMLASTQENQIPITFVVALDDNDRLFSAVPSYIQ